MKQLNFTEQTVSLGHMITSVVVVVLAAIFAFMPIFSINLSANSEAYRRLKDAINAFDSSYPELSHIEVPEKAGVSFINCVTSAMMIKDLISVGSSDTYSSVEAAENLDEMLENPRGREAICMLLSFVGQVIGDEEDVNGFIIAVRVVAMLSVALFALIYPVAMAMIALVYLIRMLKNLKNPKAPEKLIHKASGFADNILSVLAMFAVLLTAVPGMHWGIGMKLLLVVSILGIVANVCFSRLRSYTDRDFRYVNLVQGTSILQLTGFGVFFGFAVNAGIYESFLQSASVQLSLANDNMKFWVNFALMLCYGIIILVAAPTFASFAAARFGLIHKKNTKIGSSLIPMSICAIIFCAIPIIFSSALKWGSGGEPLYELTKGNMKSLIGMMAGCALILAGDIAFRILKTKYCAGITEGEELDIFLGDAPYATQNDDSAPVANSAPATETPAAEATAEQPKGQNE